MAAAPSRRAPPAPSGPGLPVPLTGLVGRAREVRGLEELMRANRLVTLTGPGGVGKTRLALELARRRAPRHRDGVWLVDLTSAPGVPAPAAETARVLGVGGALGVPPADALRRALATRDPLMVLDNCEHVVSACAALASTLLGACPEVAILATSREPLGVPGEVTWRLEPLMAGDATRLFVERARGRRPGFIPDAAGEAAIARLCARLDRLPLPIELAAARMSAMSPEEVLAGLDERLGGLGGAGRAAPAHHRTVRAAVGWSYDLLDRDERRCLRALAVFAGGFDAAAAAAVAPGVDAERLTRFVDKSLVAPTGTIAGRTRYRMLETIREYAGERLEAAGDGDAARLRHLRHFGALAARAAEEWRATGRHRFVNRLDDDYENVRAAAAWGMSADPCAALRLVAGARDLFFRFGQADGLRLVRQALARCPRRDRHRVEGLIAAAQFATTLADPPSVREALAEARSLGASLDEPALDAWIHFFAGLAETLGGDRAVARTHLLASRDAHRARGIAIGEGRAMAVTGMTHLMDGDPATGREWLEAALAVYEREDDRWGQGQCHTFLGMIAAAGPGGAARASVHYRAAVDALAPSRDATLLPVALIGQAGVLARRDPARALALAAAAVAMRTRVGGELAPFYRARLEAVRTAGEAALPAPEPARAWAAGGRLTPAEAIALAFGAPAPRPRAASGLSAREAEVAALVAEGLPNKAIAALLHLSVRTVESHVRNALATVGLENRTQLAAWARGRAQWPIGDATDEGGRGSA